MQIANAERVNSLPDRAPITGDEWRDAAACKDVDAEIFYETQPREAREICGRCAVQAACLEEELTWPASRQFGYRGGLMASDRKKLIKARDAT